MCFDLLLPTQLLALMLANIFPGGAFRAGGMEAGTADLEERGVEDAFLPACLDQTPLEPNRTRRCLQAASHSSCGSQLLLLL